MKQPTSFDEFWPEYLKAHSDPVTQALHVGGTAIGLTGALLAITARKPRYAIFGVVSAYAAAWTGHLLAEGNVPKTFSHPVWSLRGDLRMLRLALKGELGETAQKVRSAE